jgi:hypothetical protein
VVKEREKYMKILIKTNVVEKKEWSGSAIASFICGIISLLILPILPAIILGHIALYNIKKHNMRGKVFAIIGLISGYFFLTYAALIITVLLINNNSVSYEPEYSKELLAIQSQIRNAKPPPKPKIVLKTRIYKPIVNKLLKPQTKNLHETLDDIELAVNRENHGNFIYGVGTAALKYLVRESGIDEKMPKKTLGSEKLTKMIEDAGYTPNTDFSIAGRGGLIDYLWSTIE